MITSVDLYLDRNTTLHRLDPRVKLLGLAATFGLTVAFNHPAYVAAGAVLLAALVVVAAAAAWCRISGHGSTIAAFVRNDLV